MKKIVIIIVISFVSIGGIAIGTGLISINDNPNTIANQFESPPAEVIDNTIIEVSPDEYEMETTFEVDNPNPIGGEISKMEYDLRWSEEEDSGFSHLGNASEENLEIPSNDTIAHTIENNVDNSEIAEAELTKQTQGHYYIEAEGVIVFDFGMNPIEIEFKEVVRID